MIIIINMMAQYIQQPAEQQQQQIYLQLKKGYEQLKAISFVTDGTDEDYTIKIYTRLSDPTDPQSGTLVDTITGTTSYKGMYTIKLDKTVYVSKNDKYSVVIELTKHDGSRGAFRCETSGNISGIRFTASAAENTSFVLSKGSWVDVVNVNGIGNVRIKAYTDNMSGLIYADGKWNYYDNGVIKTDLTTLIKYNGNWFYLRGGTIDWGLYRTCKIQWKLVLCKKRKS